MWDVLAWNRPANEIFAFRRLPEEDCNILVAMLTQPAMRRLFGATWADEARRLVAQFRAVHDLWADAPAFVELLERLRRGGPELAKWWKANDVRGAAAGVKALRHPTKGLLRLSHASFQANDDPCCVS